MNLVKQYKDELDELSEKIIDNLKYLSEKEFEEFIELYSNKKKIY